MLLPNEGNIFNVGDTVKVIKDDLRLNYSNFTIGESFIVKEIVDAFDLGTGVYLRSIKGKGTGIHSSLCQKISLDIDPVDKPSIKVKTKFNVGDFVYAYDKKFPYVVFAKGYGENYKLQDPSSKEIIYSNEDNMTLIDIPKVSITRIQRGDQIVINNKSKLDSFFHKYYGRKFEVERFDSNGIYTTIGGAETFIPVAYINKIESIVETSEPILNTNINNQMSTTLDKVTIEKFYSNDKNIEAVTITKEELADYKKDLTFLVNIFSKYKSKVSEMEYDFNEAIASDNIKEIKVLIKTIGTRLDSLDSIISETIITDLLPVEEVTIETKEESVKFWNN